jgi:uncharacterized membrane protein
MCGSIATTSHSLTYYKEAKTMQMQEPEQWQQSEPQWQTSQEYGAYRPNSSRVDGPKLQEKIHPHTERKLHKALWIITTIISSIGFFFTVTGIIASAIVLEYAKYAEYANGQEELLVGGVMGLISSILVMLVCTLIFVIAIIALASQTKRRYR